MKTPAWSLPLAVALAAVLAVGCAGRRPQHAPPPPPAYAPPPAEPAPPPETPADPPPRPEQDDAGRWRVSVISVPKAEDTESMVKRLQGDGFRVETEAAEVDGKEWQRVILPGLPTFDDAQAMIAYVQHTYGASQAWVLPRADAAAAAAAPEPAATPPAESSPKPAN